MDNDLNQAVAGGDVTAAGVAPQPSGQGAAESVPQQQNPQAVTEEVLEQRLAEAIRRMKQSERDRAKQIDAKLEALKSRLEAGGAQLQPAQVSALREQLEADLGDDGLPAQAGTPKAPTQAVAMNEQVAYLEAQMGRVFARAGMEVTPADKEWQMIQAELDNPAGSMADTLYASLQAAQAKAARVAQNGQYAAARVASVGDVKLGDAPAKSASDYWGRAYQKK